VILGANFRAAEARKITGNVAIAGGADFSLFPSLQSHAHNTLAAEILFSQSTPQLDRLRKKVVLPSDTLSQLRPEQKDSAWDEGENRNILCIFLDRVL
jgi:hypothetical protein